MPKAQVAVVAAQAMPSKLKWIQVATNVFIICLPHDLMANGIMATPAPKSIWLRGEKRDVDGIGQRQLCKLVPNKSIYATPDDDEQAIDEQHGHEAQEQTNDGGPTADGQPGRPDNEAGTAVASTTWLTAISRATAVVAPLVVAVVGVL